MLTRALCALVMTGASLLTHAVEGAFGWSFKQTIEVSQLGASTSRLPGLSFISVDETAETAQAVSVAEVADVINASAVPIGNEAPGVLPRVPSSGEPGRWFYIQAAAIPAYLAGLPSEFAIQLSAHRTPVWLIAKFTASADKGCARLLRWAQTTLRKKYNLDNLRPAAAADGPLAFTYQGVHVAAGCNPQEQLQIEYQMSAGIEGLDAARAQWKERSAERRMRLAIATDSLAAARKQEVVQALVSGDAYRVDRILGIDVHQRVKPMGSFKADHRMDLPLHGVAIPFYGRTAQVELDPEGYLVRVEAYVPDAHGKQLQTLKESLQQQFGVPTKANGSHVIFQVGQDYLILRRQEDQLKLSMVVTERERAQKARVLLAAERRWQEETAGL